jgi:hypothetical protein
MSKTDQLLACHDAQLGAPIERRGLNPLTGWLPLSLDEAWLLVRLDLTDTPYGCLMGWQVTSDCPNTEDHDIITGECLCWDGVGCSEDYEDKEHLESQGPFEWWPTEWRAERDAMYQQTLKQLEERDA